MNITRQIFGTRFGSNRPVSPRQREIFSRGYLGRGQVTFPEVSLPATDGGEEVVSVVPRFLVDFGGQHPAGMTINVPSAVYVESSLPAAA